MARTITPDDGSVTYRNNIEVGMIGQEDHLRDDDTVCHAVVGDLPEYVWASDPTIRSIINELLVDIDWNGLVGELSGGQRRRCDLARVLVGNWEVLLMDEPTNHLDLHAIRWLAEHLKRRWQPGQGALLVVTHDRWFLDEVCEHMWEVHDGQIDPFEGGYSAYIQQRVERQRQAAVMEERRQNMLRKELNWLAHGAKARTSKPKFRIDAAMELIANDPPLRNPIELKRMAVGRLGKQVIEMHNVSVSYGDNEVIHDVDWLIGPGDRYGILGENGAGKTTLLKAMTGALPPSKGLIKIGASVRFGMLSQQLEGLSKYDDWRVQELLAKHKRYLIVDGKPQSPEQLLERLGFERREFPTYIKDLSGGQRRRLAILCVLMEEPNVLVLDEPGNDLDTDMLAVLEDLLDTWPGTLLLVSHDSYLMERVTDDQFALIDGSVRHVPGGVDEYLSLLDANPKSQVNVDSLLKPSPSISSQPSDSTLNVGTKPSSKLTNIERRTLKKRFDAVSRKLEKVSSKPQVLRDELLNIDSSDYQALLNKQEEISAAEQELEELETEWLELSERLGE